VGDHNDGDVALFGDFAQHLDHIDRPDHIQGGGGFVGEDDVGVVTQRPGDGGALVLAAGELAGHGVGFVAIIPPL